jgi:hypothetical protein
MDRATRLELVKTVEALQEKLNRYEAKLRGIFFYLEIFLTCLNFL